MTDKPRAKCPVCGKAATRKISGGAGAGLQGQRLLHHRLRQGRQGAPEGRDREAGRRVQARFHAEGREGREARRQAGPEGRDQACARRPPPSERRAPRRAREGGLAARRRRGRVRARASPRRGPRRSRHQPGHGAGPPRAGQSPEDGRARGRRSSSFRPGWSHAPRSPGPGFINFWLAQDQLAAAHRGILDQGAGYGRATVGAGLKVNVEFVSANPTGPLHVGHGRGAALGDAIAALLEWTGHARHPRVLHQRRRRPDRPAGPEPLGPRARAGRPPGRDPRGRLPRRVPAARTRARCSSAKAPPSPSCPTRRASRRCRALGAP